MSCGLDSAGWWGFSPSLLGFSTKSVHLISSWGCSTHSPQQWSQTSGMVAQGLNKHKSRSSWDNLRLRSWNSRVSLLFVLWNKLNPQDSPIPGKATTNVCEYQESCSSQEPQYNNDPRRIQCRECDQERQRSGCGNGQERASQGKTQGKGFKATEKQIHDPRVGKPICIRTGKKMSVVRGEGVSRRVIRNKVRKTVGITKRLRDCSQKLEFYHFSNRKSWESIGQRSDTFDF